MAEARSAREAAARAQLDCRVAQATAAEAHRTLSLILLPQAAPPPGLAPAPALGPGHGYPAPRQTPPPAAPGSAVWPPPTPWALHPPAHPPPFTAGPQGRLTVAIPKPGERTMDQQA